METRYLHTVLVPVAPELGSLLTKYNVEMLERWRTLNPECFVFFSKEAKSEKLIVPSDNASVVVNSLKTYLEKLAKHVDIVSVDPLAVSAVIGYGGNMFSALKFHTNTLIADDSAIRSLYYVYGTEDQRSKAIHLIKNIEKIVLESSSRRSVALNFAEISFLSGYSCILQKLALITNTCAFRYPKSNTISIIGEEEDINLMVAKIQAFLAYPEEVIDTPGIAEAVAVGYKGLLARQYSLQFDVGICKPQDSQRLVLRGPTESVTAVKAKIQSLLGDAATGPSEWRTTILIPVSEMIGSMEKEEEFPSTSSIWDSVDIPGLLCNQINRSPITEQARRLAPAVQLVDLKNAPFRNQIRLFGPPKPVARMKLTILKAARSLSDNIIETLPILNDSEQTREYLIRILPRLHQDTSTDLFLTEKGLAVVGYIDKVKAAIPVIQKAILDAEASVKME